MLRVKLFSVALCAEECARNLFPQGEQRNPDLSCSHALSTAATSQLLYCNPSFLSSHGCCEEEQLLVGCQASDVAPTTATRVYFWLEWEKRECILTAIASMHLLYIERSRQLLQNLCQLLDDILDPRMYSGMHTTASAPSLRASESYMMMAAQPPMADDPGNVKVVVRCRAFVRRGMQLIIVSYRILLI